MSEYKLTADYYEKEQKDPERIRGTEIGKKAVQDFIRGVQIRERGPMSLRKWDELDDNSKIAIATNYFFKWLAELKVFLPENEYFYNVPIFTVWKTKNGKTRIIKNLLEGEWITAKEMIKMARSGRKHLKALYKKWRKDKRFKKAGIDSRI